MQHLRRSQYRHSKKPYRVGNWAAYEADLRRRSDFAIWLSGEAIRGWQASGRRQPGGKKLYTDLAIETALTVRPVYHLPLHQAEGFRGSVFALLGLDLPVPDHTTLSRRGRALGKIGLGRKAGKRPLHIAIDSTGLRVRVGQRFAPARQRAWRKLHLAVDRSSGEILAAAVSSRRADDSTRVPRLLG